MSSLGQLVTGAFHTVISSNGQVGSSLKTGPARPGKTRPGSFKNLTTTDTHEFIQLFLQNRFNSVDLYHMQPAGA